jgi:hypothetical protein
VSLGLENLNTSSRGEGRLFLCFYIFMKASKISGFERVGGISCYSTNPKLRCNQNKILEKKIN